jgi:hypothetical protein
MSRDRENADMTVDGKPAKRFGIYLKSVTGEPCNPRGRYDTYEAIAILCRDYMGRPYLIQVGRDYLPFVKFREKFAPKTTVDAPYAVVEKTLGRDGNFTTTGAVLTAYDTLTEARVARDALVQDFQREDDQVYSFDPTHVAGYDGEQDYAWIRDLKSGSQRRYFVEPLQK